MTDEEVLRHVRRVCLAFDDVEEATIQDRALFRVRTGNRRFAIVNGETSPPRRRWAGSGRSLHFLADPGERDALLADGRFTPSPHHGHAGWLALRLDDGVDWDEVAELLDAAHRRVSR